MYSIKITARSPVSEKQKDVLVKSITETDKSAECKTGDISCEVSGSSSDLEKLSRLLGMVIGSYSSDNIIKMLFSYEK